MPGKTSSYWTNEDLLKKVSHQIRKDSVTTEGMSLSAIIEHAYVIYLEDPQFRAAVKRRFIDKKIEKSRIKA